MKFFRFMSIKELENYLSGKPLINNIKHEALTDSEGFCFMKLDDLTPEFAYEFLSGIVSNEACVVFETDKELKKSYGIYANPYGHFFDTITQDEYCTKTYNNKDFKIIKIALPSYKSDWNWYTKVGEFEKKVEEIEIEKEKEKEKQKRKKKKKEAYIKNQLNDLNDFINEINRSGIINLKIKGKEYNFSTKLNTLEQDLNHIALNLDIII